MGDVDKWSGFQYELHVKNKTQLDILTEELIPFVARQHVPFYFNRYTTPETAFMKLGLHTTELEKDDPEALKGLIQMILDEAKRLGATVKAGTPDVRRQGDMIIDVIKELSTKCCVDVLEQKKLDINQMGLFIHFLLNESGYTYDEELGVYTTMSANIWLRAHGVEKT